MDKNCGSSSSEYRRRNCGEAAFHALISGKFSVTELCRKHFQPPEKTGTRGILAPHRPEFQHVQRVPAPAYPVMTDQRIRRENRNDNRYRREDRREDNESDCSHRGLDQTSTTSSSSRNAPILVRTDTLQYLDPRDVVPDYKFPDFSHSYSGRIQSLKSEHIERLGGFMVWDVAKKQAVPLHREQVGWHFEKSGIDPALTGTYRVKLLNGRKSMRCRSIRCTGAPPGLRSGHRASDHAVAQGSYRPLGARLRHH